MAVKVVTDSASDLPQDLAHSLGITIVPLSVSFGTEAFKDGVDLSADEFYRRLVEGGELPKTSLPSVGDFVSVYERLGQEADGIVSVHVSSKVSGTFNSAVQAIATLNPEIVGTQGKRELTCTIEAVDTNQASMGVGMVAIAAAREAQRGAGLEEVASVARRAVSRCECMALFDTLEYLEKGGRIGKAGALVGKLLRIRPMIIIRDGEVHELAKERTRKKGISRLQRETREFAPLEAMAVMHSTTPDDARMVARDLGDLLPDGQEPIIARFGPVIGTYTGPGALGIGLMRSERR